MLKWLKRLLGPHSPPPPGGLGEPVTSAGAYVIGTTKDLLKHRHLVAPDDPRRSLFIYHELRADEEKQWNREELRRLVASEDRGTPDRLTLQLQQLSHAYTPQELRDLVDVRPAAADSIVTCLCHEYRTRSPIARSFIRSGVDFERGWTLLTFSKRAAILAVRQGVADLIRDSLIAHAIEDLAAEDVRDNMVALGLVFHCARTVHPQPEGVFREVAQMAGPPIAQLLMDFVRRPDLERILSAMGWLEVRTEQGVGYRWT
jgi:hypothetical protein